MGELSRVTSGERWERSWAVETRLDLERGESVGAVGQKAIQWGGKKEGSALDHQFQQLKAMAPRARGRYLAFFGSLKALPKGLQQISNRLADLEKAEVERKSGHMWDCVGRHDGIYQFRMKSEYVSSEAFLRKTLEIAPAVEVDGEYARRMFDTSKVDESLREAYQESGLVLLSLVSSNERAAVMSLVYDELGYGAEGTTMRLPDQRELERRWAKLQEKNPMLADLRVLAAMGIASDEAFMLGHITHNTLLSEDKEFIHDQTVHVAALIEVLATLAANEIEFEKYKHSVAQGVFSMYKKILSVEHNLKGLDPSFRLSTKELNMLKRSMGAIIDLFSAQSSMVNPSIFGRQARKVLQSRGSDFYRAAKKDFGEKDLRRLPLLWTKLELATGPLYGYPKLDQNEVSQLFREDPDLSGVNSKETLWVRTASGRPEEFRYELVDGTRLVVNDGEHRFETELKSAGRVSQQDLKDLSELVKRNEKKVAALVKSIPERLRKEARATDEPPVSVDDGNGGDFVLWRWKAAYANGMGLSVVTDLGGKPSFADYIVRPGLTENVVGFRISDFGGKERDFIPASTYEQLVLHLEKTGMGGERLGSEIENHSDS